jgi:hypothetical protein
MTNQIKNFNSNKLINPDIVIDEIYSDEELIDETIDEMDDETIEIINRIRNKNINRKEEEIQEKPKIIKKKLSKKSLKKTMSLQEFTKVTPTESIKKFTSSRVESKRKQNDKRQFNPRKPPYNFIKNTNINPPKLNNINEFPELK